MTRRRPPKPRSFELISTVTGAIQTLQVPLLVLSVLVSVGALIISLGANSLAAEATGWPKGQTRLHSGVPRLFSGSLALSRSLATSLLPRLIRVRSDYPPIEPGRRSSKCGLCHPEAACRPYCREADLEPDGVEVLVESSDNAAGIRERDLPEYLDRVQFQVVPQYAEWEFPLPHDFQPVTVVPLPFTVPPNDFIDYDILLQVVIDIDPSALIPHVVPSYIFVMSDGTPISNASHSLPVGFFQRSLMTSLRITPFPRLAWNSWQNA